MEPDLGRYINAIKSGEAKPSRKITPAPQLQPMQVQKAKIISPKDMTREQVYEHLQNNPPKPAEVTSGIHPELQKMAEDLRAGEGRNRGIVTDSNRRKAAPQAVRRNVPGR